MPANCEIRGYDDIYRMVVDVAKRLKATEILRVAFGMEESMKLAIYPGRFSWEKQDAGS